MSTTFTQDRALTVLRDHGYTAQDSVNNFFKVCGVKKTYTETEVNTWLGY